RPAKRLRERLKRPRCLGICRGGDPARTDEVAEHVVIGPRPRNKRRVGRPAARAPIESDCPVATIPHDRGADGVTEATGNKSMGSSIGDGEHAARRAARAAPFRSRSPRRHLRISAECRSGRWSREQGDRSAGSRSAPTERPSRPP
ncbi:hypothetical protein OUZ56_032626, partial [Daphnia magna]